MNKRPVSVTIIGCVYILTGIGSSIAHAAEFRTSSVPMAVLVELISLLALVSGAWLLRGANWARWLALAWIAFHVVLSAFGNARELAMHAVIFAIIAYVLLRPAAARYFRPSAA
jgi:hypothetical protein